MASTPVPPQIDDLGERKFSFYPPIVNVEHNEWTFVRGNWSEILVKNTKSEAEIWIARSYLGEISKVEEPVMIMGLRRELEYKGGGVWPHTRRVLPMPASKTVARGGPPVGEAPVKQSSPVAEAVAALRSGGSGTESGMGRMIVGALVVGLLITVAAVAVLRLRSTGGTVEFQPVLQADLGFTGQNDYFDVVRKLGKPDEDRWKSDLGERQYRALHYRKAGIIVILMGADRETAHYIGAKDAKWRIIHAVELPGGRNTEPMLRSLKQF
ncbi:MAG: hypothetical protein FJW20_15070 [Acidimicrobiia bacterium]|nr:hypothetical protein [Acidimicrobiia bacterium]